MATQAVVERSMLGGLWEGVERVRYAIESQLGEGSAKWLLLACVVLVLVWGFRRRR